MPARSKAKPLPAEVASRCSCCSGPAELTTTWEYGFLTFVEKSTLDVPSSTWTYSRTAYFGCRTRLLAEWSISWGQEDKMEVWLWEPASKNEPEHGRVVSGPLDHLGDLGWELVDVSVLSTAVTTGDPDVHTRPNAVHIQAPPSWLVAPPWLTGLPTTSGVASPLHDLGEGPPPIAADTVRAQAMRPGPRDDLLRAEH